MLPALQPLVEPGGTLSGSRGQLFLRASPGNAAEIKRALEAIDRPARRLQILVRLDAALDRERGSLGGAATVGSAGSHVELRAQDSRSVAGERVDQRVQVLEGGRAFIQDGATGFEVVPKLAGDSVVLDIFQQRETQRAATSVTARLGDWVEIGGAALDRMRAERGIASATSARRSESRRVWVKIEEAAN